MRRLLGYKNSAELFKGVKSFFNGNTDYGVEFDFHKDFSNLFPEKSHRTKEIVVEIRFVIPDSYKEKGIFTWKKVWRTNDYTDEEILNDKREKPSERSRVPETLKRIKYRYVPAVKSKGYYKSLLSDLYLTVSAVLNSLLEQSIRDFSQVIQEYTGQISEEVSEKIGIDSMLTIPENLSELFQTLIFQTMNKEGKKSVPLDLRGDGIQVRHIPIILKYIADEDQKTRNQGSMKISTIWGFEEPENGVELSKAFEMANEFLEYASDIQMFITTHSPAFYMKNSDGKTCVFYDVPTIMVEGKTDKQYLELAIEILSPKLKKLLDSQIYKSRRDSAAIKVQFLQPSLDIIYLVIKKLDMYFEIEHLLTCECWYELKKKTMLN